MKKAETLKKFPEAMEVQLLPNIKAKAEYIYRRGLTMTAEQRNEYLASLLVSRFPAGGKILASPVTKECRSIDRLVIKGTSTA